MAKYNVENEYVEIDIERLLKYTQRSFMRHGQNRYLKNGL